MNLEGPAIFGDAPSTALVVPGTGEALDLSAPTEVLARALSDVRDLEDDLRTAKRLVADELHRRMDRERKWTLNVDGYKVTGESDAPKVEYDPQRLCHVLDSLAAEGVITQDAAEAAVETFVGYKVKQAGINALRKSPELAAEIDACAHTVPAAERTRRVKVSRT